MTNGGQTYAAKADFTSGGSFSSANWSLLVSAYKNVFTPETYGAKRDGTTDDTAAINAAIAAAITAGQADGSDYAQDSVYRRNLSGFRGFDPRWFQQRQLSDPAACNRGHGEKFTLVLKGVGDASSLPHWLQTTPQATGVTLRSSLAPSYDGTYGPPSIIGGPTVEQGYGNAYNGNFSNMLIVIDGLTIIGPLDPSINGVNLRGIAEAVVPNLKVMANGDPGSYVLPAAGAFTGSLFATGLIMPVRATMRLAS